MGYRGTVLVLSVSSLKGGVGKTSMTLGLASAAFSRGIPTLVVDVDPQADASTGLDVPVTTPVDIADVLAAPKSRLLEQAVVPSGWSEGKKGLVDVIPGSPRAAEFDRPSLSERYLRRLREALGRIAGDYRLVLIDCPPSLNGLTRAAWSASDRVLVVTEPGLFSVAAADRALRATAELRRRSAASLQPLGILVNRVRPNSREHSFRIDELKEMFGPLVINPQLPERTVLQQAQGSARPIHAWPGKPAAEMAAAFDKILDRALRSQNVQGRRAPAGAGAEAPAQGTASDAAEPGRAGADGQEARRPGAGTAVRDLAGERVEGTAARQTADTTPPAPSTAPAIGRTTAGAAADRNAGDGAGSHAAEGGHNASGAGDAARAGDASGQTAPEATGPNGADHAAAHGSYGSDGVAASSAATGRADAGRSSATAPGRSPAGGTAEEHGASTAGASGASGASSPSGAGGASGASGASDAPSASGDTAEAPQTPQTRENGELIGVDSMRLERPTGSSAGALSLAERPEPEAPQRRRPRH